MLNIESKFFPYKEKIIKNVYIIRTIFINLHEYWNSVYISKYDTKRTYSNINLGLPRQCGKQLIIDNNIDIYQFVKFKGKFLIIGYINNMNKFCGMIQGKIQHNKFILKKRVNDEELMNYINSFILLRRMKNEFN